MILKIESKGILSYFSFDLIEPLLKRDESIKEIKSNRNMIAAVGNSGQQ